MATPPKKQPKIIDITQHGIPEKIKTFMLECPSCKNQWVVKVHLEGFAFEKDFKCVNCGTVIINLEN